MTRIFKSTITDWVAIPNMSIFGNVIRYYDLYNAKYEYGGRISCRMVENSNDWEEITKKPILETQDNFVKYEGDIVYLVHSEDWSISKAYCSSELTTQAESEVYFHSIENAKAYIERHKPRYSNEDLNNLLVEVINRTRETKVNHNTVKDLIDNLKALRND